MAPDSSVSHTSQAASSAESSPSPESESGARPAILLLGHGSHINGLSSNSVHELARELRATGRHPEVRVAFWKEEPQLRHALLLVESSEVVAVPFFTSEGYFTDRVLPRELGIEPPVSEVRRVARPGERSSRGRSGRVERRRAGRHSRSPTAGERESSTPPKSRLDELDDPIRVHYTRAVGAHPTMADAVLERARDRLREEEMHGPGGEMLRSGAASPGNAARREAGPVDPASAAEAAATESAYRDTTLVVLGHGTERHPDSGAIVERLTERLGRASAFAAVTCCFLDQEPRMLSVLEALQTRRAVVVPFFMAEGWHVGETIPRDLKLEEGRSRVGTTEVLYADPVGTHPAMVDVVEEMVAEAVEENHVQESASDRRSLPARAREAFLAWIDGSGDEGRVFLETRVRVQSPGSRTGPDSPGSERGRSGLSGGDEPGLEANRNLRYEVRHVADREADAFDLERGSDPEWARVVAARTEDGDHRPLKTAPNLGRGWILENLTGRELWDAYAHLYPTAPIHWYLETEQALPRIPFRETAERQTGIYRVVGELDDTGVEMGREEICEKGCLRRVRWPLREGEEMSRGRKGPSFSASSSSSPGSDGARSDGRVPCPEACSVFVSHSRARVTRAKDKSEEPQEAPGGRRPGSP